MKLVVLKSGNDKVLYIQKTFRKNGVVSTRTIKTCGKLSELQKIYDDPISHFKEEAIKMTKEDKETSHKINITFCAREKLKSDEPVVKNIGYLFLRKIFRGLGLDKIVKKICEEHKFEYDLESVLEHLIYSRIITPGSKLSTFEDRKDYVESGEFELQHIYRALTVLNEYFDYIQAQVYKNSHKLVKRNKNILYFDCTNFYFEIEQEDEFRRYGISKEHRPNPIVQMGLFMDGNGIPLAFDLSPGNTNEQITLRPLETKVLKDFDLSKLIVCTDAGLASYSNREFNDMQDRAFIVTQSIKKLPKHLREWALETDLNKLPKGMTYLNGNESDDSIVLYKSRHCLEDELVDTPVGKIKKTKSWRLIVTYSKSYALYQKRLRQNQINRAKQLIANPSIFNKTNSNDCKRFVKNLAFDSNGEIVKSKLVFDEQLVIEESMYDGFYALSTNLEGDAKEIVALNHNRWKIEESFRIMKTDLKSRPVFVSLKEHIFGHFLTCFLALLIVRIIDNMLKEKYTTLEILETLRDCKVVKGLDGYYNISKGNECLNDLCSLFNIEAMWGGYSTQEMREIINQSKV